MGHTFFLQLGCICVDIIVLTEYNQGLKVWGSLPLLEQYGNEVRAVHTYTSTCDNVDQSEIFTVHRTLYVA